MGLEPSRCTSTGGADVPEKPAPHEARPDTPASNANTVPSRILDLFVMLFGMMASLREEVEKSLQMCV